jgi:hypothetical protein
MRGGVQRASTILKKCPMNDDACAAKVIEHVASFYAPPFDAAALVEKQCGRFSRGKYAGKLRGWASIEVVAVGGWKRYGFGEGNGRVVRPGMVLGITITDYNGKVFLEVR